MTPHSGLFDSTPSTKNQIQSVLFVSLSRMTTQIPNGCTIPGHSEVLKFGNHELNLFLDMGVGIGGDKWPAEEKFCNMLIQPRWKSFWAELFSEKVVLELGAGTGMAGILIDKAFSPIEVIITDQPSHMAHITQNIATNAVKCSKAVTLDWRCLDGAPRGDIVLAFEW